MAPKARDLNPTGLGRAIINKKAKDARRAQESGLYSVDTDSSSKLKSITQEKDLDEFLNTAELAATDFTAERRNVKIIQQTAATTHNPHLLTDVEEQVVRRKHSENSQRLRVPRRPAWKKGMSPQELDRHEKASFLEWRRGLAELQDQEKFLLTPFERNIEVWRQLWRVVERSHLVVQIVDARNPLRFRCEDLESYARDVEGAEGEAGTGKGKRRTMLLVNKADLITSAQRVQWADYFDKNNIQYAFYSAATIAALQQARKDALAALEEESSGAEDEEEDSEEEETEEEKKEEKPSDVDERPTPQPDNSDTEGSSDEEADYFSADEDGDEFDDDPRAKILSVDELEELFIKLAPDLSEFSEASGESPTKHVIGLVGYPNVGKSSTINSLLGEKKVSVSSTPGKTKHFQTIMLSDNIVLCDCPGLVFPQFATTKADLVCDGVLPIDQLREHTGPVTLVAKRIPRDLLEATYGLKINTKSVEEGGDDTVTAENLLIAFAIARGFMRSGQGNPDEARAARYILKDYVSGKLLFCHPPPGIFDEDFNRPTHLRSLARVAGKKMAPTTRVGKDSDTFVTMGPILPEQNSILPAQAVGHRSHLVDQEFFEGTAGLKDRPMVQQSGQAFSRSKVYPHQNFVTNNGAPINPAQARLIALIHKTDTSKKHKKPKRVKQRSGKGYD